MGGRGQWDRSSPSAFSCAPNAGSISEGDVATIEMGQFGDPQPSLGCQKQQRTVAAAFPPFGVGCLDSVGLCRGEKGDEPFVELFGGIAKTRWITAACSGVAKCGEAEQGTHGSQSKIAGACTVVSGVFEVVEEGRDQVGVEVAPLQAGGRLAGAVPANPISSRSESR